MSDQAAVSHHHQSFIISVHTLSQGYTYTNTIDLQRNRNQGQPLTLSSPRAVWNGASGKGNVTGFPSEVSAFALGL